MHEISFVVSFCFSAISFFFNDTATTEIYTLSLHDALPISINFLSYASRTTASSRRCPAWHGSPLARSEEHTSELQSQSNIGCRLLIGKKQLISKHLIECI